MGALVLAPLPRGGRAVRLPQAATLRLRLAFGLHIGITVFDLQLTQVLRVHPGRTFPPLFGIGADAIEFDFADNAAIAVGLGPFDDDRLAEPAAFP